MNVLDLIYPNKNNCDSVAIIGFNNPDGTQTVESAITRNGKRFKQQIVCGTNAYNNLVNSYKQKGFTRSVLPIQ